MIVMGQQKHMENALGISRRIYKRDIPGCGHMCVCICICIYGTSRYKYTHNTQHAHATVCLLHAAISACVYYLAAHYTYIIHKAKHRAVPHA
jgi:hypothetical protein